MTEAIFRNWNNSVLSTPRVVAVPRDLQELIEVVRDKSNYPSPLRVGGSFHSLNACFVTEGTQILLRHFDQIRVDTDEMTVTVGAAVKMFQVRDALKHYGMQTAVTPEIGNGRVGGVLWYKRRFPGPFGIGAGQLDGDRREVGERRWGS